MRLVFFNDFRLGVIREDAVVDITHVAPAGVAGHPQVLLEEVIARWGELGERIRDEAQAARPALSLAKVRLRPCVPRPGNLVCSVRNYADNRASEDVDFFLKSPSAIIGPGDVITLPDTTATRFLHEAEVAVVVGRRAFRVPRSQALQHIFGYTPFIDVSARGMIKNDVYSFFLGKSWDTFAPIGPYITTADEVTDPNQLQVTLTVNGTVRQDFNTSAMTTAIPELIEFASSVIALEPGDVLATGTHHGGYRAIEHGDVLTITVERLGQMTVSVDDPQRRKWPKEP